MFFLKMIMPLKNSKVVNRVAMKEDRSKTDAPKVENGSV